METIQLPSFPPLGRASCSLPVSLAAARWNLRVVGSATLPALRSGCRRFRRPSTLGRRSAFAAAADCVSLILPVNQGIVGAQHGAIRAASNLDTRERGEPEGTHGSGASGWRDATELRPRDVDSSAWLSGRPASSSSRPRTRCFCRCRNRLTWMDFHGRPAASGNEVAMSSEVVLLAVMVVHGAFLLLPSFGAFLILRWRRFVWIHLLVVAWYGLMPLTSIGCPLTAVENELRGKLGLPGYRAGFEQHYVYDRLGRYGILWTVWNLAAVTAAYALFLERGKLGTRTLRVDARDHGTDGLA